MNKPEILIIGGTGQVGSELISLLTDAGINLRVFARQASSSKLRNSNIVQIVQGDLAETSNLELALAGIRQVFLLTRDQANQAELEGNLIALAKKTGVEKIVKSSAFAAGLQPPVGYGVTHAESERQLMDSGLDWVILRPYAFMQNFLDLAGLVRSRSLLPMPLGDAKIGFIDARDVAVMASTLLTGQGHEGLIYELTGPDTLTIADCANIMSRILERRIRYRSPPWWLAGLMMRAQGVSAWDVLMRKQLFRMIRENGESRITSDFEDIVGHKPRSLDVFIRDYQHYFQ